MAERKLSEHEIKKHHLDVKREADAVRSDRRRLDEKRDSALDRADRREWAHKKFGDERRWRE